MSGELHDYLPVKTADYSGVLDIPLQGMLLEEGEYPQKQLETDGRVIHIITLDEVPDIYGEIDLTWLTPSQVQDVFDMYFNPLKAKGMARTFYWDHPIDGYRYVIRFMSKLSRVTAYNRGYRTIQIKIEGYRQ